MKDPERPPFRNTSVQYNLDALMHPAQAFARPHGVIKDEDLTASERRRMLASWASDACAIEAAPALRPPGAAQPVHGLRLLDSQADGFGSYRQPRPSRAVKAFRAGGDATT